MKRFLTKDSESCTTSLACKWMSQTPFKTFPCAPQIARKIFDHGTIGHLGCWDAQSRHLTYFFSSKSHSISKHFLLLHLIPKTPIMTQRLQASWWVFVDLPLLFLSPHSGQISQHQRLLVLLRIETLLHRRLALFQQCVATSSLGRRKMNYCWLLCTAWDV